MSKSCWALRFKISDAACLFRMKSAEKTALEACYANGTVSVSMAYSVNEQPLLLESPAAIGDTVRLNVCPHRIEMYVNDVLPDEEWPWGECLAESAEMEENNVSIEEIPYAEPVEEPSFCGSFTGAQGWRPGGGVFVGDCMPYTHEGRYHVLYLKDRRHHKSKWGLGAHQWDHISSADLLHWDIHPMAVAITDPMEGSICTGSWIYENGRHMLYYTVRKSDRSAATIERSVSTDGYHFEKDPGFRFTLSEAYHQASARDPKVIRGEDGLLHMLITTSQASTGLGALAHLVSSDGDKWTELEPIYIAPDDNQPECPDYFAFGGKYYLVFSHHGSAQYRVSDKPFSDWQTPANPAIPCEGVPKAAIWNGRIIFTGFLRIMRYAGTLAFMEAVPGEDGMLSFKPVAEMV